MLTKRYGQIGPSFERWKLYGPHLETSEVVQTERRREREMEIQSTKITLLWYTDFIDFNAVVQYQRFIARDGIICGNFICTELRYI